MERRQEAGGDAIMRGSDCSMHSELAAFADERWVCPDCRRPQRGCLPRCSSDGGPHDVATWPMARIRALKPDRRERILSTIWISIGRRVRRAGAETPR
jgi:hypothetical protein